MDVDDRIIGMEFAVGPFIGLLDLHHSLDIVNLLEGIHFYAGCVTHQADNGRALAIDRTGLDAVGRLQPVAQVIHFVTGDPRL